MKLYVGPIQSSAALHAIVTKLEGYPTPPPDRPEEEWGDPFMDPGWTLQARYAYSVYPLVGLCVISDEALAARAANPERCSTEELALFDAALPLSVEAVVNEDPLVA